MADNHTPEKPKKKNSKVGGILMILGMAAYVIWMKGFKGPADAEQTADAPERAATTEVRQREGGATADSEDTDTVALGGFSTVGASDKGAVMQLKHRIDELSERVTDVVNARNEEQEQNQQFREDLMNKLDQRLNDMAKLVDEISMGRALSVREDSSRLDGIGSDEGVGFSDPGVDGPGAAQDDPLADFPEMGGSGASGRYGQPRSGREESSDFPYQAYTLGDQAPGSVGQEAERTVGFGPGVGLEPTVDEQPEPDRNLNINDNIRSEMAAAKEPAGEYIEIPAGSMVDITNLHGADCPVATGVSQVDDALDSITKSGAVTFIANGQWKGPQGNVVDIGKVQLIGLCQGIATSERAAVTFDTLSYIDESGKSHEIGVTGYLHDKADNLRDARGIKISTAWEDIGGVAVADTFGAMANAASAGSYAGQVTAAGTGQAVPTNVGKGAVLAGAASGMGRISNLLADRLVSHIELVRMPPAKQMKFHLTKTIKVPVGRPDA